MTPERKNELRRQPVKMLTTIVNRGMGETVTDLFRSVGILYHMILLGRGTANSDLLSYLGLDETEKDVVLSVVRAGQVEEALTLLREELEFDKPGHGIAFTIPIGSVGGARAYEFISGQWVREEEAE